jgi:hypothetical protein
MATKCQEETAARTDDKLTNMTGSHGETHIVKTIECGYEDSLLS